MQKRFPEAKVDLLHAYASANPRAEVTAVVRIHNDVKTVEQTLESIRQQRLERLDLVIVDDDSADESATVAASWIRQHERRFDRATLVRHRTFGGVAGARNTGVDRTKTPYYFALDAKDQLYPRCLSRCLEAIKERDAAAAYTQLEHFGARRGLGRSAVWNREWFLAGGLDHSMALVRRDEWNRIGGYGRMEVGGLEDVEFWCNFFEADAHGVFVPEILCRRRTLPDEGLETLDDASRESLLAELTLRHPWAELVFPDAIDEDEALNAAADSPARIAGGRRGEGGGLNGRAGGTQNGSLPAPAARKAARLKQGAGPAPTRKKAAGSKRRAGN